MVFVSFSNNFHLLHLNANHNLIDLAPICLIVILCYLLICEYAVDS